MKDITDFTSEDVTLTVARKMTYYLVYCLCLGVYSFRQSDMCLFLGAQDQVFSQPEARRYTILDKI